MSETKQIATSTLWQVGSQAVMAILSILTVKFVAVGLSKELAGNYNSAYGFLQLFGILADFGLYAVAVREVSQAKNRAEVMGALIILRSIILIASLALALGIVWIMPMWRGTPFPIGVTIASLVPFFTLLAGIQRTVFQVEYRMKFVFAAEVTQRIVAVLLIGTAVYMGTRESNDIRVYEYFLLAGGIGAAVLFALSTFYAHRLQKITFAWDPDLLKELFLRAAPYGFAFLCTALYRQLDVTLIALLRYDYDLQNAYYGFALRATEMAYLFPTFLLNSTLPLLSKRTSNGEDTKAFVGKIFFAIMLLSTTAFLYASLWARPIMGLLTTDTYLSTATTPGADTALRLLAIPMLLNGIVLFAFYNLLTHHAWRPLVATLSLGAILSLLLNLIFIPRYGFTGAACVSIVTHIFLALILLPQSLKVMPMSIDTSLLKQWGMYTLLLGGGLLAATPVLTTSGWTVFMLAASIAYVGAIAQATGISRVLKI